MTGREVLCFGGETWEVCWGPPLSQSDQLACRDVYWHGKRSLLSGPPPSKLGNISCEKLEKEEKLDMVWLLQEGGERG